MSPRSNRRRFLTAVGIGTLGLAGCTNLGEQPSDQTDDGDNQSEGSGNTSDDEPDEEEPREEDSGEEEDPEETEIVPPAIDHGELLHDFGDVEQWGVIGGGEVGGDPEEALVGEQALRVENPEGGNTGVFRAYPDGLDIQGQDLSIAVRIDSPRPTRLLVQLLAPYESDHLASARTIVEAYEGWLRADLGYTNFRGEPDLSNVQEIRIYVEADDGQEVRFWLDDLRATPQADQGYVMLTFDDNVASQYDNAFPLFEERDMQGVLGVIPPTINLAGRLTVDQLREMRDAGWDVSAQTEREEGLTALDPEQARSELESDRQYLEQRGFPDGARAHFVPYHDINQEVAEIIREIYDFNSYFGGNPALVPPSDPIHVSRTDMYTEGFTRLIDMAERFNQLAVGLAHGVGDGDLDDITEDELKDLLDYIEDSDVELITVSDLLDGEVP